MNETANYFHNAPAKESNTQSWCDAQASICSSWNAFTPSSSQDTKIDPTPNPSSGPKELCLGLCFSVPCAALRRTGQFGSILLVLPEQKKGSACSGDLGFYPTLNPQSNPVAEQCDSARLSSSTGLRHFQRCSVHNSDSKIKCLSLAVFFLGNLTNKTETGTAYPWGTTC
jgi:hypothetical protein